MPQPKLPSDLKLALHHLGLNASCYQPVGLFKKDPPRKLPNVPREDDPWHVVLRHADCSPFADGSQVAMATGDTLREAIEKALASRPRVGLMFAMSGLGAALDDLAGVLHGRS